MESMGIKLWGPGANKRDISWSCEQLSMYLARKLLRHGVAQTKVRVDTVEAIQHPWHCFSNCDPHTVPLISNENVSLCYRNRVSSQYRSNLYFLK
jgi:hypothetical protein